MYQAPVISALPTDSEDYHLLVKGVELSKEVEGLTCEIGLRLGGGSALIIDAISKYCPGKTHIAIDPYGHIEYEHKEKHYVRLDYTNEMRDICLENLYRYCRFKKVNFLFFNLADLDFFDKYADGVISYDLERKVDNQYSMVFLDGPHAVDPLKVEIDFFKERMLPGACIAFDDVQDYYDHSIIDQYLTDNGFKLIEITKRKALYQYAG